jgi:hypothetical protein
MSRPKLSERLSNSIGSDPQEAIDKVAGYLYCECGALQRHGASVRYLRASSLPWEKMMRPELRRSPCNG